MPIFVKLNYFVVCSIIILCCRTWARDSLYYNYTQLPSTKTQSSEFGFGIPPLGNPLDLMWTNSFAIRHGQDMYRSFSSFRWSPTLIKKLDASRSLILVNSLNWSAEERSALFKSNSLSSTFIASVTNRNPESPSWIWSYGFLLFDRSNHNLAYPIVGFSYSTEDLNWRFNVGYPNVAVVYLGWQPSEASLFFSRENSKTLLKNTETQPPEARYIHESLNMIGLSYKMNLQNIFRLSFKMGSTFASQFKYLNDNYNDIGTYIDHSGESFVAVSLAIDFRNHKKN